LKRIFRATMRVQRIFPRARTGRVRKKFAKRGKKIAAAIVFGNRSR